MCIAFCVCASRANISLYDNSAAIQITLNEGDEQQKVVSCLLFYCCLSKEKRRRKCWLLYCLFVFFHETTFFPIIDDGKWWRGPGSSVNEGFKLHCSVDAADVFLMEVTSICRQSEEYEGQSEITRVR